ncbi:MAG: FAD:protein FMN transferase [Planctomycetes bacterium]|nr:FAD:protein FMN transferase [Planctomycetota bacterium]
MNAPRHRLALVAPLLAAALLALAAFPPRAAALPPPAAVPPADDTQVLLTKSQALRLAFPGCEQALEWRRLLDAEEKRALERTLGRSLDEKGFLVYLGLRGGALDGCAVITNEIGKTEPITFLVAAELDGRVRRCAVMVYRESHGGEVRSRRFLAQLEGRTLADPIAVHRDVIHVSGATLSSHALCNGTRKVLALLAQLSPGDDGSALLATARTAGAKPIDLAREPEPPPAAHAPARIEARRLVMGSELAVVALTASPRAHEAVQQALAAAEALDAVLSDWRDDSELAAVNRVAARGPVAVSAPFADFLAQSRELWQASGGAFDPAIGPLVRAWGFRGGPVARPADATLAALVGHASFAQVEFDAAARTVAFRDGAVQLDPGAIGKGMAVDAVVAALRAAGIDNAFVDFGSTQRAIGGGEEGDGWPVAIRDPADGARALEVVLLRDAALSTSGSYEKFVEIDGERLPHLLDPRDGRPARGSLSASVIAATGARADALSTALFVLRGDAGLGMLSRLPDAAGLLLPERGAALRSPRWPGAEERAECATR